MKHIQKFNENHYGKTEQGIDGIELHDEDIHIERQAGENPSITVSKKELLYFINDLSAKYAWHEDKISKILDFLGGIEGPVLKKYFRDHP